MEHTEKRCLSNKAGEPRQIIFLTCDISGVFPPVAILSKEAAVYHFLSGYTARIGSTEIGGEAGITATFSSCFGAPFMPRYAKVYGDLLMRRIEDFGSHVYLVNTGWYGGSGSDGKRFPIPVTRSIVHAIQSGQLEECKTDHLEILNLDIPTAIPNVDAYYINPRKAWKDVEAYDKEARRIATLFTSNISKFVVDDNILTAGICPQ